MSNDLVCKICGKECKRFTSLAYHLKLTHHIDSKNYYDLYLKGKSFCKTCEKENKYYGLQKGYTIYCSTKCSNADPEIKNIISIKSKIYSNSKDGKEIRSKNGKKNKGIKRSEEFCKNISMKMNGHVPWNKNFKGCYSKESLNKMSISQLERFLKEEEIYKLSNSQKKLYMSRTIEDLERISKSQRLSQIKRFSNPKEREKLSISLKKFVEKNPMVRKIYRQRCLDGHSLRMIKSIKKISKEEIKLRDIIKELFPRCEFQYSIFRYLIDVAIPEYKIAIEYDGYYHFDTEEHKGYHKERQEKIENDGWKFLRYNIFQKFPNKEKIHNDIMEIIRWQNLS